MKKNSKAIVPLLLLSFLTSTFTIHSARACSVLSSTQVSAETESCSIASLPPINWTVYHNYTEIVEILLELNQTYANVTDVFSIGRSWWDRDIYCVRLTNETDLKPKPEVFFVGYHHAREPITSELTLYFVVYAATNFGLNQTVTELLNNSEIYVVVALNVDGFDLFEENDWQRKNSRPTNEDSDGLVDEDPPEDENGNGFIDQLIDYTDPERPEFIRWEGTDNDGDSRYAEDWKGGVDLNRNYNYSWEYGSTSPRSEIYKGPQPFSEPETRAIRDLVLEHNFKYAISFHSGAELILYPWGCTHDPPPLDDEAKFIEISGNLSVITGGTEYMQSSYLYFTYGVWDDWMYAVADVFPFTCEIFSNGTWEGVREPGPYPSTYWEGGLKYSFNPFPEAIESVILRWLPTFFYVAGRAVDEFHDVAVSTIEASKTVVCQGFLVKLNVTVQNKGFIQETFNLTTYVNTTILQTQTITLPSMNSTFVILTWNTTGFVKGNYTVIACVSSVPGETKTADDTLTFGTIIVSILGDVNGDGIVEGKDIALISKSFGTLVGQPNYVANADINGDGRIEGKDVAIASKYYGTLDP